VRGGKDVHVCGGEEVEFAPLKGTMGGGWGGRRLGLLVWGDWRDEGDGVDG